eukprot:scaffold18805_cov95-Cyclotella_meneghiniana.AAC.2
MLKIIRQNETDWAEKSRAIYARLPDIQQFAATQPSPVCRPNLNVALPDWRWDNTTKFERIYFYHARKAGGTSLAQYFKEVAKYHGLEFVADEWNAAEEPGHNNVSGASTFYVTHLREPVDRAISHFKYQGRWNCANLSSWLHTNTDWIPTHSNAMKIESWDKTEGHVDKTCKGTHFRLGECAINCYTQWFSGLSCPQYNMSTDIQHSVALAHAIEQFFGVKGVRKRRKAFCEKSSAKANALNPINITQEILAKLHDLNEYDLRLYNDLNNCGNKYEFGDVNFATKINK